MEESLFLNTLAFEFPREPKNFYFSLTGKKNVSLTKLSHQLFPANIRDIFPDITNDCFLYTSFTRKLDGFTPLRINFATDNYALVKRYYNREIKHYFTQKNILVEPTFIKDNQIWLRNTTEKAPNGCTFYDKFTIKVNFNHFSNFPELVLSYDRKAKVFNKSVSAFLSGEEDATADLFNRVVHVEYFENEEKKSTRSRVTKYEKLMESERAIDYNNVYPIVGKKLAAYLSVEDEEENDNPYRRANRYTKYLSKIVGFYNKFLNNEKFQEVVPISDKGFDPAKPLQIGKTTPQSKQLVFGKNKTNSNVIDVIPQRGVNNGPFNQPPCNNIQMFFITSAEHMSQTNVLSGYIKNGYKAYKGLLQYTNIPVSTAPKGYSIAFTDSNNPLPEIEEKLQNTDWVPGVKYLAIYLTPVGKHVQDKDQRKIYFQVKEKLLKRNITSQCIETEKMIKVLDNDSALEKSGKTGQNFAYSLQNIVSTR